MPGGFERSSVFLYKAPLDYGRWRYSQDGGFRHVPAKMKAIEKRNHLLDEADKIEVLSSEIVIISEDDVQEKPSEPKIPGKNQSLARRQKAWRRFTGCMRCCTSIQVEESHNKLPDTRGTIMADSKANEPSKETEKEENKNIKADDQEAELYIGRIVEEAIQAAYQHQLDLIHRQEYKNIQCYGEQLERASCEIPTPIISGGNENKPTVITTEEECCTKHDEENTISNVLKNQPAGKVPLTLECFTFYQKLGEGGFAKVYLAKDVFRNEHVAIKVSDKRDYTERGWSFAERHILQLSHKSRYLIHGLAAFHTLNFVYYVMELTTRGTLRDLMRNRSYLPLDSYTVKFIISEIICGTQFLHRNGIIHRDLKPPNILVTADGHIKITDFGISVINGYDKSKNKTTGTAGYAAPEMVMGQIVGSAVDYFAIGVIIYQLLTQKRPFPGRNRIEVKDSIIQHVPSYPSSLSDIEVDLLKGLLCKNPLKRYGIRTNIRSHPYFQDVNWEDVEAGRMVPPAIMTATSVNLDVNNSLHYAEPPNSIQAIHQKMFNKFSFVCAEWSLHYDPVIVETKPLND